MKTKRKVKFSKLLLVTFVILMAVFLFSMVIYNYQGLMYYSKNILGMETHSNSTTNQLSEASMGQTIEERFNLEKGRTFTIDSIMADEKRNLFYLFYTISFPEELLSTESISYETSSLSGFQTQSRQQRPELFFMTKDRAEQKGMYTYDYNAINAFAKKLNFEVSHHPHEVTKISFPYNPNQVTELPKEKKINETTDINRGSITLDTITTYPNMTVIKGNIDPSAFNTLRGGVQLVADNEPVTFHDKFIKDADGTFELYYNPLPMDFDELKLEVNPSIGFKTINKTVDPKKVDGKMLQFHTKDVMIQDVSHHAKQLEITIVADKTIQSFNGVSVKTRQDDIVPVKETKNEKSKQQKNGEIMTETTYVFDTKEEPISLSINSIKYEKSTDEIIEIPIE